MSKFVNILETRVSRYAFLRYICKQNKITVILYYVVHFQIFESTVHCRVYLLSHVGMTTDVAMPGCGRNSLPPPGTMRSIL